jgi:hypothetical protein
MARRASLAKPQPKQIATTLTCSLAVSPALAAGLPLSKWNTIDDNTGKVKSEVQLYDGGSKLYGKIIGLPEPKAIRALPLTWKRPIRIGGPSRTRTLDPLIKSQLLYQLS